MRVDLKIIYFPLGCLQGSTCRQKYRPDQIDDFSISKCLGTMPPRHAGIRRPRSHFSQELGN